MKYINKLFYNLHSGILFASSLHWLAITYIIIMEVHDNRVCPSYIGADLGAQKSKIKISDLHSDHEVSWSQFYSLAKDKCSWQDNLV